MEKDFASCFRHQHHSNWQSPNLNCMNAPLDPARQNTVPAYMNPSTNMVSTTGTLPASPFSGLPHSKASQPNDTHGWFYCLPSFRQAFTPVQNSTFKEKIPAGPYENRGEAVTPNTGSGCAQKRFLVFDQSGDQTTLIFSSGIGTPVQCLTSWTPRLPGAYVLNREEPGTKRDTIHNSGPNLTDEYNENHGNDVGSEMREDTEELNALLYSDDDDNDNVYSEDDEEMSTGHSPSTMTAYEKQEWFEDSGEEVASSAEPTKRRKLSNGGCDVPLLMDTATSMPNRCFEYEDDAESSCADGKNQGLEEFDSLSSDKGSRKEKIRETVSVLQSIIPGGKGKDAIVVLDEAIHYLKSLKRKAEALGLDSL
uniref:Putative fructose-bisphosphate aldolase cytoplasmic isozyme n=1 Tax=Davidia involucrata TaxID=16924 RepID=A0A5B6ZLN1_DAVIN